MKLFTFILTLIFSSQAFAHVDHALGDGNAHKVYHIVFYVLLALVVYRGIGWFLAHKKKQKS